MSNIDWASVIKKEARGRTEKDNLGKVQKVWDNHILTVKGILKRTYFYISKELVDCFDGQILRFRVTEKWEDTKGETIINIPHTEEYSTSSSSIHSPLSKGSDDRQTDNHVFEDLEESNSIVKEQSLREKALEKEMAEVSLEYKEISFRALPYKNTAKPLPFQDMPILTLTLIPLPLPDMTPREREESHARERKVIIPLKQEEVIAPLLTEDSSIMEEVIDKKRSMTETKRIKDEILREIINLKI